MLGSFCTTHIVFTIRVYRLHYEYNPWPHILTRRQLRVCPIKMSKRARDVVRKMTKLTQLFSKKEVLFQLTLSEDWAQTQFLLTWLWFHSPLLRWMKSRTCTKSGFSRLGPLLLCLSDDGYTLPVLPQFLTLRHIVLIWTFDFLLPFVGLEPYVVHSQPWLDPVLPEHSTRVGPLHLSVVAGPLLLPSSLLPWPRTHSNVLPLHRQDGETARRLWPVFTLLFRAFPMTEVRHKSNISARSQHINKNTLANVTVDPRKFLQSSLSCPFQVLGFLLASFGFVEFFYILLERSQEIQQHMVFLLSPIIRSMTVVNTVALS